MVLHDSDALDRKPRLYRYFFYLLSSFRIVTLKGWMREGEPNPFVQKTQRVRVTHRQEIQDIFEESLGRR